MKKKDTGVVEEQYINESYIKQKIFEKITYFSTLTFNRIWAKELLKIISILCFLFLIQLYIATLLNFLLISFTFTLVITVATIS